MKKLTLIVFLFVTNLFFAQKYHFKTIYNIEASKVKSQGKTGTCWSFSTSSFLESEIYRLTKKNINISEMYSVRATYPKKAWNYVMRQGKTQFSEGGLSHDVMNAIKTDGLVPESAFTGLFGKQIVYNHHAIVPAMKAVLDAYIKNDIHSKHPNWKIATDSILNKEIGKKITTFTYNGTQYTPMSFLKMTKINPADYVTLTSYTHKPYYSSFILNIPDNFSNGSFYNVPLEDLTKIIDLALKRGFSLALDIDVSEKTFSAKNGIAFLPKKETDIEKGMTKIVKEIKVTPSIRQKEFENYNTTDDHLMHIIGLLKDQKGNLYYNVKNSWGNNSQRIGNNGYVNISENFVKMKAISILVHKDALSKKLKKKLGIH